MSRMQLFVRPADKTGNLHLILGYGQGSDTLLPGRSAIQVANGEIFPMALKTYCDLVGPGANWLRQNAEMESTNYLTAGIYAPPAVAGSTATLICDQITPVPGVRDEASFILCGAGRGKRWLEMADRIVTADLVSAGPGGRAQMKIVGISDPISARTNGLTPGQILEEPMWGFGKEKVTLPKPLPMRLSHEFHIAREADLREFLGEKLGPMQQQALQKFRDDHRLNDLLPTYNISRDARYGEYIRGLHEAGMLFGHPDSMTESQYNARSAAVRDVIGKILDRDEGEEPTIDF